MSVSLQADSTLPQGYILVDGQRVASVSTTGGLSATLAANTVTTSSLVSGSVTTEKIAPGAVVTADLADGAVTFDKISQSSGPFSFRNKIINGNFDIWQRGSTHGNDGYGSADRWLNSRVGTTCTMSSGVFVVGQIDVPNEPRYFCRMTVTSLSDPGNFVNLQQRIEDVRTLAGRQVTVSFYAKADSVKPIAVEFAQIFGTGTPTPTNFRPVPNPTKLTLSTTWQKYTVTTTIPSISSTIVGSNNDGRLELLFWLDAGSIYNARTNFLGQQSGTFDFAQIQLEEGPVATPFEQRPIGLELSLCQRYFQTSYPLGIVPGTTGMQDRGNPHFYYDSVYLLGTLMFPVEMRATPTVVLYQPSTGAANTVENYVQQRPKAVATNVFVNGSEVNNKCLASCQLTTAFDPALDTRIYQFHYTASAEL